MTPQENAFIEEIIKYIKEQAVFFDKEGENAVINKIYELSKIYL
jgi:hypothetical protein